jgi:hypothetical protein
LVTNASKHIGAWLIGFPTPGARTAARHDRQERAGHDSGRRAIRRPGRRIAAAFHEGVRYAIADLIGTAEQAALAASERADCARALALDPTLPMGTVAAARKQMYDAFFARDRLQVALEKLRERLLVVQADEEDARRLHIYEDAEAERDRLAAELRDFYPDVAERLAELLARIVANDEAIERINAHGLPRERGRLLYAELTARNLTGWILNSLPLARRLTDELQLPAFELRPGSNGYLWPRWR